MRTRWIVAGILVIVGLAWIGQGLGIIRGSSFMTDDTRWALIGLGTAAVGVIIGATAVMRRSAS
jgi:hypothetical protein